MLALMRIGDDAYGVPIAREIEAATSRRVVRGNVYLALERLASKGLVTSTLGEPTAARGGRAKRYFYPTALGVKHVRDTQRALTTLWNDIPQLKDAEA